MKRSFKMISSRHRIDSRLPTLRIAPILKGRINPLFKKPGLFLLYKGFASTYYCVYCLQLLNELNDIRRKEIRETWFDSKFEVVRNLRLDKNVENVYFFIKTAQLLMNKQDEYDQQLGFLRKRIQKSFSVLITKHEGKN